MPRACAYGENRLPANFLNQNQWFGNVVTMDWWDDLWLNEGFATYFSHAEGTARYDDKQWTGVRLESISRILLLLQDAAFVSSRMLRALTQDSINATHPIRVKVAHPDEIVSAFDGITYGKGASVIRMLAEYLGEDVMRKALQVKRVDVFIPQTIVFQAYIHQHKYRNTVTEDLWREMSAAKDVSEANIHSCTS